ncbi:MAG: hypothetical protein C0599_11800 [Salinivirgaceae bacterium]|nr:MAG: hypothetical protein C0599_11800 [Salinivirgaceae bacterium]
MKVTDIISMSAKPALYEKGTAFMWTDEHISKQLLQVHLNEDVDLASRKMTSIVRTANWILETLKSKEKLNILDLGCGPGLYAEILTKEGHNVTGVDISANSIAHAKKSAQEEGLDINYINESYIDLDFEENTYDLILIIFTDIGVLVPEDRNTLLQKVYRALKPGGTFIFDVLSDNDLEQKIAPKNWEASQGGFWNENPYIALSESFLYAEEKVILYQHLVMDNDEKMDIYRFYTHFFSTADIKNMIENYGFKNISHRDDILPEADLWNGKNVIFTITSK